MKQSFRIYLVKTRCKVEQRNKKGKKERKKEEV
jgi:hypothetical protein